jgi:hypothetical protein
VERVTTQAARKIVLHEPLDLSAFLPMELRNLGDLQTTIPRVAKDASLLKLIPHREGPFKPSARVWLGYLMLLADAPGSTHPVKAQQPHFKVFEEFRSASYAKRYEIFLTKLVRERLYDSTCFLMSNSTDGPKGSYTGPVPELNFSSFVVSLLAKAIALKKTI